MPRCRAQLIARCDDDVGAGDVDDVGRKGGEVAADGARDAQRQAIFGAAGDRDGGDADDVADRLERRLVDRRRIDPHLRALAQEIVDQPVERLVGAVADIIVIAREQGDAELFGGHGWRLSGAIGNRQAMDPMKRSMAPVGAARPLLLVLGSLPGEASLKAQRYYAHPQNQFWRLLGGALGEPLAELDYEARLARLAAREVGVVGCGRRRRGGTAASTGRCARSAPIRSPIMSRASRSCARSRFNGQTAARIGRRALGPPRCAWSTCQARARPIRWPSPTRRRAGRRLPISPQPPQ